MQIYYTICIFIVIFDGIVILAYIFQKEHFQRKMHNTYLSIDYYPYLTKTVFHLRFLLYWNRTIDTKKRRYYNGLNWTSRNITLNRLRDRFTLERAKHFYFTVPYRRHTVKFNRWLRIRNTGLYSQFFTVA